MSHSSEVTHYFFILYENIKEKAILSLHEAGYFVFNTGNSPSYCGNGSRSDQS